MGPVRVCLHPEARELAECGEVELSVMIRQCLNRRVESIETRSRKVAAWQARRDRMTAKAGWPFTTQDAHIKLKRLYPTFDA